ncbi:MAG: ABC transporter permease [Gammaproteobacteria bacterium]
MTQRADHAVDVPESTESWASGGGARGATRRHVEFLASVRDSTYVGLVTVVVALVAFFVITEPLFSSGDNVQNLMRQGAALAILAVGQAFVILIGGIDISVGAQVSLVSIFAVDLAGSLPLPLALAIAVLAGCSVGLINGLLVTRARISPIVATIATWQLLIGFNLIYTQTQPKQDFSEEYRWLGGSNVAFLPTPALLAIIVGAVAWVVLTRMRFGRYVYAIGGNREAARLSGINVNRVVLLSYVLCSLFAAVAGLVLSSRVGSGSADLGLGLEITAIAAVFIGGVAWGGGAGSVIGVILGVVLLAVLSNGLDLAGTDSNVKTVMTGALMLVAVGLNNIRRRDRG